MPNPDTLPVAAANNVHLHLEPGENMTFLFSTHAQGVIDRVRRVITLVGGQVASDTGAAILQAV